MIAGYLIDDGKVIETTDKNDMAWIDVVQPTDTELQYILNEYSLPKDYLYDVGDVYEVPRVEGLDDDKPDLFVISYPVKKAELAYATRVVSVIVVSDVVITIRQQLLNWRGVFQRSLSQALLYSINKSNASITLFVNLPSQILCMK